MTAFAADISHYQAGITLSELRKAGVSAVVLKVTESDNFADSSFTSYLAEARRIGMPVAAYHFLHSGNIAAQAAWCARHTPADVPVFVDAEGGLSVSQGKAFASALKARGRRVPVIYNSHNPGPGYGWWRAAYLSDPSGDLRGTYARQGGDSGRGWVAGVDMWQYCQHGHISGHGARDIDWDAFRGTGAQLIATGWWLTHEEDDVQLTDRVALGTGAQQVLRSITGQQVTEMQVGDLLQRVLGNVLAINYRPAIDVEALAEALAAHLPAGSDARAVAVAVADELTTRLQE